MSNIIKKKRLTREEIEAMMERAIMDEIILCPYCEYGDLEPDYERCPECSKKNPLKTLGLI
ncbi:MAG: hypothetical protein JXA99_15280 [Candidatus Lokiarchaeota archaeon]|nr:hypothetical protein [Candidatus Lokiarchaeota archaeon]